MTFLTGGGLLSDRTLSWPKVAAGRTRRRWRGSRPTSWRFRGSSPRRRATPELATLHPPGCEVAVVHSGADELARSQLLAVAADWTLLIAPESDGALLQRARLVESVGGRLLSPCPH